MSNKQAGGPHVKQKPRIFKADDGWAYQLPAFGFGDTTVKSGHPSREAAGRALADQQNGGSGSQLAERASVVRSRFCDMNVPMVVR